MNKLLVITLTSLGVGMIVEQAQAQTWTVWSSTTRSGYESGSYSIEGTMNSSINGVPQPTVTKKESNSFLNVYPTTTTSQTTTFQNGITTTSQTTTFQNGYVNNSNQQIVVPKLNYNSPTLPVMPSIPSLPNFNFNGTNLRR
ncbi:MAG: hypothetical protein ACK456_03615 [Pseudanabaenaceae cyanobacterium]|jgi:hypothetical protein